MIEPDVDLPPIVHAVAARPADGETHCGDHWVAVSDAASTLLSVIDGLGHGEHARTAAHVAADTVVSHAHSDLATVMTKTHDALRTTRGAAMSLAMIVDGYLRWLAVGNVQGVLHHAATGTTTRLITRGGIVGSRLPRLQTTKVPVEAGDVLAMFTDGVDDNLACELTSSWEPRLLAPWLLDRHANGTDDALVLVARHGKSQP